MGLWPWSGLRANLFPKPSKAQLAQQGFYKRLAHPGYEVIMPQWGHKAV